jgi:LysR family transcriptional activator of nhaA
MIDRLNYHHLYYFWIVTQEGSVAKACEALHLAQPTISSQIRELERQLGSRLFIRSGRGLALTETGRTVRDYANEIFKIGNELVETIKGSAPGRPLRLVVGIADVLPKMIVYRLLEPIRAMEQKVQLICKEGKPAKLLTDLGANNLDVVLSDQKGTLVLKVKAHNHLLGASGLTFFGTKALAAKYQEGFPQSLHHAPMLLASEETTARQMLEEWLSTLDIQPEIRGEFEDSALLKIYGQAGEGIFAMPSIIEEEICRMYGVTIIGRDPTLKVECWAITNNRRNEHPAVAALCESGKTEDP